MRIPYLKEKLNEPFGKLFVNTFIEVIVRTISIYGLILLGSLMIISYEPIIFYVSLLFIIVILAIYWFFTKENRGKRFFFIIVRCMVPKRHTSTATWVVNSFYKDFPKIKTLFLSFCIGCINLDYNIFTDLHNSVISWHKRSLSFVLSCLSYCKCH